MTEVTPSAPDTAMSDTSLFPQRVRHWPSFLLMLCSFTNQVLAQLNLLRYEKPRPV